MTKHGNCNLSFVRDLKMNYLRDRGTSFSLLKPQGFTFAAWPISNMLLNYSLKVFVTSGLTLL